MVRNGGIARNVVADAVPDEGIDAGIDMGEDLWHLRRVLRMALRNRGRDDLPLGSHTTMLCLPAVVLLLTMFLGMPFTLAADLQVTPVNDERYGSL